MDSHALDDGLGLLALTHGALLVATLKGMEKLHAADLLLLALYVQLFDPIGRKHASRCHRVYRALHHLQREDKKRFQRLAGHGARLVGRNPFHDCAFLVYHAVRSQHGLVKQFSRDGAVELVGRERAEA